MNKVVSYSKIEGGAIKRNGVAGHFGRREGIEDVNRDMSEVSFLN